MDNFKEFKIDLKALKDGNTTFNYNITNRFFTNIEAMDIKGGELKVDITIHRSLSYFELFFTIKGYVIMPCDKCLEDMQQTINTNTKLVVRFGHEYSEEDDLVVVAEDNPKLDVSWFVYEFIQLNIPIKHVHAPGKCDEAMIKMLNKHSTTRSSGRDSEETIDPRWSKLKDLKIK